MVSRRLPALLFLLLAAGLAACGVAVQAAPDSRLQSTLQPTETARPLITPTVVPTSTPRALPDFDWRDLSVFRQAMKPGFEADVDGFADANRYLIEAALTLEPDAVIRGAERVRYTNHSADSLDVIVFRLYPNTPALGGRMNVTYVTVNGRAVAPSLSNLRSVMGVPLETPLAPGESVELTLDFNVVMTRGLNTSYGRFGYVNNVISATAWYPTLSVYESGIGWWTDLPSPQGDPAYTESGLYDVRLTVPGDMTVAASGTIIETRRNPDTTVTYRDVTGPMRDHAFQASARYAIRTVEVGGTRVNVVFYGDRADDPANGTDLALQYSASAVRAFNRVFGDYPFAELDIAQNPTPSGVEFPGLVQIAEKSWVRGNDFLEKVIAHEIGHQWFYSLIGNNQVGAPWLDESLTSYTEFVYMRETYPDTDDADRYVADYQKAYTSYTGRGMPDLPLALPVGRYFGFSYGAIVYTKGPLFIVELERQLGRDMVYKALAAYFAEHKYGVVTTPDVERVFEAVSGADLSALFAEWVTGSPPATTPTPGG